MLTSRQPGTTYLQPPTEIPRFVYVYIDPLQTLSGEILVTSHTQNAIYGTAEIRIAACLKGFFKKNKDFLIFGGK